MTTVRQRLRGPARTVIAIAAMSLAVLPGRAASAAIAASPSPAVKYYVVHDPHYLQTDYLRLIASRTLGNASLYMQIFDLNQGRLQPDGKRLEPGSPIDPGWILVLPPSAHGSLVHFGPLPLTGAAATASPSPAPSQPQPARTRPVASVAHIAKSGGTGFAVIMVAALAGPSILAGVVTFLLTRRSRRPSGRHHGRHDVDIWSDPPPDAGIWPAPSENAHQAS